MPSHSISYIFRLNGVLLRLTVVTVLFYHFSMLYFKRAHLKIILITCVLKASTVECQSILLIDTLDLDLDQCSIDIPIDTLDN